MPDEKVHVVHRGTDMNFFNREAVLPDESAAMRLEWELATDRPVILLLGRLTSWKGHMLALEALAQLKGTLNPFPQMVFVGRTQNADYENRLRQKIKNDHLEEDVVIAGHTDKVPTALSFADIVIAPLHKTGSLWPHSGRSFRPWRACHRF